LPAAFSAAYDAMPNAPDVPAVMATYACQPAEWAI